MAKRYELSDAVRNLVANLFVESHRNGLPRVDDRLMLNGVLRVFCSKTAWRNMR
jgi:transposase